MVKKLSKPAAADDDDDVTEMLLPPGINLKEAAPETPPLTLVGRDPARDHTGAPGTTNGDEIISTRPETGESNDRSSLPGAVRATAVRGALRRVQIKLPRAQRKLLQRLAVDNKHQFGFAVRDWEVIAALLQSAPDTAAGIKDLVQRTAEQVDQRMREDERSQIMTGDLPEELVAPIDERLDHLLLDEDFRCSLTAVTRALIEEGPKTAQELREAVTKVRASYGRGRMA